MVEIDYKLLNTVDINKTLLSNGLIVVRNAILSLDEFEMIANNLGKPVVTYKHILNNAGTIQEISQSELFGNDDLDWHNDLSYGRGNYDGAILYNVKNAHLSPTWFMDMSKLPDFMYEKYKENVGVYRPPIEHTDCFTDRQTELIKKQKMSRPFVFNHPISDQRLLYCSPGTIQECNLDLTDIIKFSEQNSYKHQWMENDLLIWDNLRMMHRRFAFSGERILWRTQFKPNYMN